MDGLNRQQLLGNLGADPELRFTNGGQAVLNLRLATTTSYFDKNKDQRVERTDWHAIVVWGKRGEALSKLLVKGDRIYVEGETRHSEYEDKDKNKRWKTEVHASEVILAGGGKGADRGEDRGGARDERPRGRDEERGSTRGRDDDRRGGGRRDDRRDERGGGRDDRGARGGNGERQSWE
jgi:single-strand DNA-binding protein